MLESVCQVADNSVEVIETIRDSIVSIIPHIREMSENSRPEPYTVQNITLASWNLTIAIIAAIFGFLGALFGYLGYKFSKKTAHNVVRVSVDVQQQLCYDFIMDLYKNTMFSIIYMHKYKENKSVSPNNIIALHLPAFNDIFHIDVYNQNSDVYIVMKHLKDRMYNYNEGIRLCCDNIKDEQDLTLGLYELSFKPMHILIYVKYLLEQMGQKTDCASDIFKFLLKKHIKHIIDDRDFVLSLTSNYDEHKYHDYICEHKKLNEQIDKIFKDCNSSVINYLYCDNGENSENIQKYLNIIDQFPDTLEYVSVMKKEEWNCKDLHSVLINMIVMDAILYSRS